MAQRVFIKVVGFSDEERHAINTLFRVSENSETQYQLWAPEAPEPARVALLDGDSWEARLEAESPSNGQVKMIWVGAHPPSRVWRNFPRPLGRDTWTIAVTRDGARITLLGNIEFPSEAAHCLERGAEGVGLYRTEFLYLNKSADPTEAEHYEAYRDVVGTIGPNKPVVIRTLDLGADKFSSVSGLLSVEKNPFLGLRSVRLCLRKVDLFRTQLRAILRAAVHGDIRIMFPMISTVEELRQCKTLLNEVKEDLDDAGLPYKPDIPIGTMIEVPSAALLADVLAREVDFFSVGTNDLIQYTLAADRNNEHVAHLYDPADPAVLRLIRGVVQAATQAEIDVNVCGEMSGEPLYTPLLVGLGLRSLSATPRKIPEIKRVIRQLDTAEAEKLAGQALRMETARQVQNLLRDQLRRILPEAVE